MRKMNDELAGVREHLNADHADTIDLIGRFVAAERVSRSDRLSTSIGAVDARGVDLVLALGSETEPFTVRHRFSAHCASVDEVSVQFFALLNAARNWAGDDLPLTSLELELAGSTYTTFISEVAAVVDITPTLRQVTFRGGLDEFESLGGDQFLYVLLPPRDQNELTVDADFTWQAYDELPEADRPSGGYYTVRAWREDARELDVWFVLHGDEGASSAWASRAEPGQPVALWGPRRVFDPPSSTRSYVLIADETGFGAVGAVLDELLTVDPMVEAIVLLERGCRAGEIDVPSGPNISVTWLDRAGSHPGTTSLLIDAVTALDIDQQPEESTWCGVYAFGAGESRRITEVRKFLRDERGLPAEQVSMTGYWRAS